MTLQLNTKSNNNNNDRVPNGGCNMIIVLLHYVLIVYMLILFMVDCKLYAVFPFDLFKHYLLINLLMAEQGARGRRISVLI